MRVVCVGAAIVLAIGCGGGGSGGSGGPNAPSANATTVSILGERGAQSFSPNPASPGSNQMVAWRNNDSQTHRIVLNDGSMDTGDIAPAATSTARRLPDGAHYHCSIHPEMIGAINTSNGAPAPPCVGVYC